MSQAIAQSATQLTTSLNGEDSYNFVGAVARIAEQKAKGITRERQMINRQKLISSVCADYRANFAAIYGKTDRLPSDVYEKIESAVDDFIRIQLNRVNSVNAISLRRSFYHNSKDMMVIERVTAMGENQLTLEEQLLGVNIFINQAERKLKDLEAKPTPDYDREKDVKQSILRLTMTKNFILGEIEHQKKAVEAAKS